MRFSETLPPSRTLPPVSMRSLVTPPALTIRPLAIKRSLTILPASATLLLAPMRSSATRQETITTPWALSHFMLTQSESLITRSASQRCPKIPAVSTTRRLAMMRSGEIPPAALTLPWALALAAFSLPAATTSTSVTLALLGSRTPSASARKEPRQEPLSPGLGEQRWAAQQSWSTAAVNLAWQAPPRVSRMRLSRWTRRAKQSWNSNRSPSVTRKKSIPITPRNSVSWRKTWPK